MKNMKNLTKQVANRHGDDLVIMAEILPKPAAFA